MTSIIGILRLQGAPLSERDFVALAEPLSYRAENGWCKFISEDIVSGFTLGSRRVDSYVNSLSSNTFLAWDGRLDSKMELLNRLVQDHQRSEQSLSDNAIVAATISNYGVASLREVIGDWALSFWDYRSKELVLARDFAGMRPLYYRRTKFRLLWSSDLEALLTCQEEGESINREYLGGLFAYGSGPTLTPFTEILAVPPGHALVVGEGRERFIQFWRLDDSQFRLKYRTDAEYEEHFRDIFYRSVRDRLQTSRPVFAELSGGLDSTSIACVAALQLRDGAVSCPSLHTVSDIYDDALESDESAYIRCAEGVLDCHNHHLLSSEISPLEPIDAVLVKPSFSMAFAKFAQRQGELMRSTGATILLSGIGGDEMMCNAHEPTVLIAGELRKAHLKTAWSILRNWSRRSHTPMLPTWMSSTRLALNHASSTQTFPKWMTQKALRTVKPLNDRRGVPSRSSVGYNGLSASFWSCLDATGQDRHRPWPGITSAYPFLDRRIVEFIEAIPVDQLVRPGESRSLQRRVLRGVIPEKIRVRRLKKNPTASLCRALDRLWESVTPLMEDSLLESIGWIDPTLYRKELNSLKQGVSAHVSATVTALMIERWYRDIAKYAKLRI